MKSFIRLISLVGLFFSFLYQWFAIEAPTGVVVENKTSTSISLSWDAIEEALGYMIYYWTESWIENGYNKPSEAVDTNSFVLENLLADTTYYLSVVALDDNAEEWPFSDELIVDIVSEWGNILNTEDNIENNTEDSNDQVVNEEAVNFVLEKIEVIAYDKLELSFSTELDTSEEAVREFKITNKNDTFDTFEVLNSEISVFEPNKILLTLDRNTEIWNEYDVVIIAITNFEGKNIESWIDNSETFVVSEIIEQEEEEVVEESVNEEEMELNSASEEQTWVSWTNLSSEEVENNTLALAENNKNLPKTWPEHILLIVLSIILWTLIFKFRKS